MPVFLRNASRFFSPSIFRAMPLSNAAPQSPPREERLDNRKEAVNQLLTQSNFERENCLNGDYVTRSRVGGVEGEYVTNGQAGQSVH